MRISIIIFSVLLISCKGKSLDEKSVYKTKTGMEILVKETHPNGASLSTIEIFAEQFANGNHFILENKNLITRIEIGDLDKNGFDELYIFTQSAGSGTYGNVISFASNRDKSLSPVYIPEITKKEMESDGLFEGYRGHDTFILKKDHMTRKFPIYKEGGPNNKSTGREKSITYILKKGEASWQLNPIQTNTSEVQIVRNCSGTYIKYKGLDYKVCNEELLATFKNESNICLSFRDSVKCEIPKDTAVCMLYHPFVGYMEVLNVFKSNSSSCS